MARKFLYREFISGHRCVEGRLMRHDPQHDDPYLETDRGECPECEGKGCKTEEEAIADLIASFDLPSHS